MEPKDHLSLPVTAPEKSIHNLKNKTYVGLCICCLKNKTVVYRERIMSPERCVLAVSTKAPESLHQTIFKRDHLFKVHAAKYS